jgi:hypothetical protein
MATAIKTKKGFQPGDIVGVRHFPFEDGTGHKEHRFALVIDHRGKEFRVRGIFSRPGYGRAPIAADYYNGLNHDSHLQARVVTVHAGQITGRIGEAAYDYDPFEDFLDQ